MRKILLSSFLFFIGCIFSPNQSNEIPTLGTLILRLSKVTISGQAAKGSVKNALVKVSALQSNGECESVAIAESKTDDLGNYTVEFRRTGGVVCLQVLPSPLGIASVYDEKSRKNISIPADSNFKLVNIIDENKITTTTRKLPISAITSMIANRVGVLSKAGPGVSPEKLVKKAGKEVVIRFGLRTNLSRNANAGIRESDYPELIDLNTDLDSGADPDSKKYLTILSGFSELANTHKKENELTANDIQSITEAFATDMSSGKFDGTSVTGESVQFTGTGQGLGNNSLSGTLMNGMKEFVNAGGQPGINGPSTQVTTEELAQYTFNDTVDILAEEDYGLPSPPSSFTYNPASVVLNVNSPANLVATLDGTPTGCKITPNLPSGLTIAANCTITGTPANIQPSTVYTVTAITALGQITSNLTILINPQKPDISYSPSNLVLDQNTTTTHNPNIFVYGGGTITNCTSNPALPTGLNLTGACQISGTPGVATTSINYSITVMDSFGSTNSTTLTISITDKTPPNPINPILNVTNNNGTSLTLSWEPAADNFSSSANLQYAVYQKLDETNSIPNFNDPATVTSGTLVRNYSTVTTASITGLTPEKSAYWFNIVVMDEAGNKSVYTQKMVNTAIFILDCENSAGNFGGFEGVNGPSLCGHPWVTTNYADNGKIKCNGVRAFISFPDKELKMAPGIYGFSSDLPVVGIDKSGGTRTRMFSNWPSMFSTNPLATWNGALKITVDVWTFTTPDGSYDTSNNCSGGTSISGIGTIGIVGSPTQWLTGTTKTCNTALTFVAICY
jgi:hypothetical protein